MLVKLDHFIAVFTKSIAIACFAGLMILLSLVVFARFVPVMSTGWSDEVIEWLFAWMVFMGAARMWRDSEHFRITFLEDHFKGTSKEIIVNSVVQILSLIFLGVMTYYGGMLTLRAHDTSPVLVLPRSLWYLCVPLSGAIMIGYSIRNLLRNFKSARMPGSSAKTQAGQNETTGW